MPDPYERHGRNSWEWGPSPSRGQSRAAAADQELAGAKRSPAKKDPDLCKAAHWKGLHRPKLHVREYGWRKKAQCKWTVRWGRDVPVWHCVHEEVCTGCGKILRIGIPAEECPDFHPVTEAEQDALEAEIERWRERRAARRLQRPVIDGPQGYRKKKET
jgi:hypothetical protein